MFSGLPSGAVVKNPPANAVPSGAGHFAQGPGIIGRRAPPADENRVVRVEGSAPEQKSSGWGAEKKG